MMKDHRQDAKTPRTDNGQQELSLAPFLGGEAVPLKLIVLQRGAGS